MLDDFEINFLEEFSHITDCGTSVDKNHEVKRSTENILDAIKKLLCVVFTTCINVIKTFRKPYE